MNQPRPKRHFSALDRGQAYQRVYSWFESTVASFLFEKEIEMIARELPKGFGRVLLYSSVIGTHPLQHSLFEKSRAAYKMHFSPVASEEPQKTEIPNTMFCVGSLTALPFENDSIDTIVLHHALDIEWDVYQVLREAVRVLAPGGQLVILGFNPFSLFGASHFFLRFLQGAVWSRHFISSVRLSEWMHLLDLDMNDPQYAYNEWPLVLSEPCAQKTSLKEQKFCLKEKVQWGFQKILSLKWLQFLGAIYLISAKKKNFGMTFLPNKSMVKPKLISVPVAQFSQPRYQKEQTKEGDDSA